MVKVFFITQGCSMNDADTEVMKGLLVEAGHEMVVDEDMADVVVFNSCTVKGPTESFFWRMLDELEKKGKKVVVTGCIPQSDKTLSEKYSCVGTYQIDKIVKAVEKTMECERVCFLDVEHTFRVGLPKVRKSAHVEIIPINSGCLDACTYCKTKQARGGLHSYSPEEIIAQAKKAVSEGVKQIWLTSQDTAAYGFDFDKKYLLPDLVSDINEVEGDFFVRVGMGNPNHILKFVDELIQAFKGEKIFKFLHIPVQSGNDSVLKLMKRSYSVKDFLDIVKRFRKEIPDITISTDVILGFPTETEAQFEDTLELVRKIEPDVVNISRFWLRPGTEAEKLSQWPHRVPKERSRVMTEVFYEVAAKHNLQWVGWKGRVLIDEEGKNDTWMGRNFAYKQMIVPRISGEDLIGKFIEVEVKEATKFDLRCERI